MPQRRELLAALAAAGAAAALPARAQRATTKAAGEAAPWPTQPVKLLVGFPAGSTPDLSARAIAEPLAARLGQPVVVENRPGASGNIAADLVAKATDQHTLGVMINGNLTVARLLNAATPFDPAKDFAPLSLIGVAPLALVAAGSAAGSAPAELLAWARGLGAQANYGTPGNGTVGHLGMELIKSKTGIAAVHVPYPGNPQVINALLAGQLHLALLPPGLALPHVRSGKLKTVGVTSPVRSPLVPELPTLRDAGVSGAELEIWNAVVAPASLPRALVARLGEVLVEVIRAPGTRERLFAIGWQAVGTSPEGLANRMKADTALLAGIIQARGITASS